jgi:TolB-like protein/DNA-binding winged helix-turn-helix (wHTH) protein/Flp pilus assembly protein TadD
MAIQPIGLPESIAIGEGFELDLRPRRLRRGSRMVKLERIPLEILRLLLERPGEIVTREDIVARVWGNNVFLDTDNSIRNAIRKIRQALKDDPGQPRFIQTVTGQGYRFIAPIFSRPREDSAIAPNASQKASLPETKASEVALPAPAEHRHGIATKSRWLVLGTTSVVVLTLAIAFVILKKRSTDVQTPKIRSLAVLPLKNMSGDPNQEYFADEMTEELIGRLAAIHDLRVISRTSVMQFKDPKQTIPEIARTLDVDAIVEGSVIRDGNHIRVHAQLIRAVNDEHFWSETYDREMGDVLMLESDIAQSIAQKVEVTVSGHEQALLAATRKVSPEAYESFLKAAYANDNTKAGMEQRAVLFQDAINKDPSFAPAYLRLGSDYVSLSQVYSGVPPEEMRLRAIGEVQKALELDPDLTPAHVLLGEVYQQEWRWSEAGAEFKRALELTPNDADASRRLGFWLIDQGRIEEGLAWSQRARVLDPANVSGLVDDGFLLFLARHYDESTQNLRNALVLQPDNARAHWFMGYDLIAKGQPEQAIPELEKSVALSDRSPAVIGVLIRAYAHAGRRADALRMLEELKRRSKTGYIPAGAFINAYLGLGDKEQAFVWLERGYEEKSGIITLLKVHPHFDSIRNDPRFADLAHRVGLDQTTSNLTPLLSK